MNEAKMLDGIRVLVLEDDYYLADDTCRALANADANLIGPFPNERAALAACQKELPDAAVVDINVGGAPTFELANTLKRARVPFLFLTGYDEEVIPNELRDKVCLQKPVGPGEIIEALERLIYEDTEPVS